MASDIKKLYDLPEVSFIDDITADTVLDEMISDFQEKYYELSGEYEPLSELDKNRILINATTLKIYQAFQYIDRAGKMNLLKYSTGDYLINLGANRGVTINEEKAATCDVQFTLSAVQNSVISIPAGTPFTAGDGVYFMTESYCEIPIGSTSVTINAICQITGTIGNGYEIGQLNILSEPIAYVDTVSNVSATSGGEDIQSDEDFRETIFLAPSGYSTAGPEDAYIYWAKRYSSLVSDVKVNTPSDDTVQVVILKQDGEIPDESFLSGEQDFLTQKSIKPMTEQVIVIAPTVVNYDITGTYYISKSNASNAEHINSLVTEQIDSYIKWQKEKIGRDISPFYLQHLLAIAGVKRVDLTSPVFTDIDETSIAIERTVNLVFGGIEDD